MSRLLATGLALTVLVTLLLRAVWGPPAIVPGLAFGGLATLIEAVAVALIRPVRQGTLAQVMARRGIGMGLRLLGVIAFAVAVALDRQLFPPLPTAFGYLGVLLPLLYAEMWFAR